MADTQEFYTILTQAGKQKEMDCLEGKSDFDIWEIALGDGNGNSYDPEISQTSLKNECWRGLVDKCENEENTRYAIVNIPAQVGGFIIREIGAYDKSGELIIIGKCAPNEKRLPQSGDIKQLSYRIDLSVINELILPFIVDPSINTPSVQYIEKHFQSLNQKAKPEGYAPLDINSKIPLINLPDFANPDLSNLTPLGNTKILPPQQNQADHYLKTDGQNPYWAKEKDNSLTPFSIVSCNTDTTGQPDILYAPGIGQGWIPWVNPAMASVSQDGYSVSCSSYVEVSGATAFGAFSDYNSGPALRYNKHAGGEWTQLNLPSGKTIKCTAIKSPRGRYLSFGAVTVTLYLGGVQVYSAELNCEGGGLTTLSEPITFDAVRIKGTTVSTNDDWGGFYAFQIIGQELLTINTADTLYFKCPIVTTSKDDIFTHSVLTPLNVKNLADGKYTLAVSPQSTIVKAFNQYCVGKYVENVDISGTGTYISGGDYDSAHSKNYAFDDNINTCWQSSQTDNNIVSNAYIGSTYVDKETFTSIGVCQGTSAYAGRYANLTIQTTQDGNTWDDLIDMDGQGYNSGTLQNINLPADTTGIGIRVLAKSIIGIPTNGVWIVSGLKIYAKQKNVLWLDTSKNNIIMKDNTSGAWTQSDYVPIGSCTVEEHVIQAIYNRPFDYNGFNRLDNWVSNDKTGSYCVYPGGLIEQQGKIISASLGWAKVQLYKEYSNTNYYVMANLGDSTSADASAISYFGVRNKTKKSFEILVNSAYFTYRNWHTKGY